MIYQLIHTIQGISDSVISNEGIKLLCFGQNSAIIESEIPGGRDLADRSHDKTANQFSTLDQVYQNLFVPDPYKTTFLVKQRIGNYKT